MSANHYKAITLGELKKLGYEETGRTIDVSSDGESAKYVLYELEDTGSKRIATFTYASFPKIQTGVVLSEVFDCFLDGTVKLLIKN